MHALAGEIGERNVFRPAALAAAAAYIAEVWRQQGYEVGRHPYQTWGIDCSNLEVTRRGRSRPQQLILVGAHYDSVLGSPGANDNASGVAALLELSRLFAATRCDADLRFVAFVNEEPPFFTQETMGSLVYARRCRERADPIRLMVSLETLGFYSERRGSQSYPPLLRFFYPDRAAFVAFVSNLRSRRWLHRTVAAFRASSGFPLQHLAAPPLVPGVGWSDHASFWKYGFPALMVTDTAFYRYAEYHTPRDTPDRIVYDALARVTSGLYGAFASLAGAPASRLPDASPARARSPSR